MSTPEWVGVSTGNPHIDQAFRISIDLVDDLRAQYLAAGSPPGWLPVSGGKLGPQITSSDTRDSRHAVQMAAYLWGDESEQAAVMEEAMFLQYVNGETGAITHPCNTHSAPAVIIGMFMACAADTYRYFASGPQVREAISRAARTVAWVTREYDPEGSGLLSCRCEAAGAFWGFHVGEPNHYPPNYDPNAKAIAPTMAYCLWLAEMHAVAGRLDLPETPCFTEALARTRQALETQAWSERYGYYFLQHDPLADKWFFSLNGLNEDSRETDVTPHYAALGQIADERRRCVARWLDRALWHDRVFPMPVSYPPYAWYSPEHPNYIDHGRDKSVIGGAWDTPYFHCIELLREAGLVETLELAVRKRAEAITRDGDCIEWYHLDGTVDNATGMHRDRYLVSATAQIAATVEGLFGVTPAAPGFAEMNIAPALPLFRRHRHTIYPSPFADRDNTLRVTLPGGRRLDVTLRYSEDDEIVRLRTNALDIPGHLRLPLDLATRLREARWAGEPVAYRTMESMGQDFVLIDHVLDGGELTLHLAPHPQKGKGTTPEVCRHQ
ncbi:MAG TPA: hypothetical protein VGM23_06090 [Armatimonadota bacterium]|jgi:hypothetical protein